MSETAENPYEVSRDSYANLRQGFRAGSIGGSGLGAVFGLVCFALGSEPVAVLIFVLGLMLSVYTLASKSNAFKSTAAAFRIGTIALSYFQICFLSPALVAILKLTDGILTVLYFFLAVTIVFSYAHYYYRRHWRAWEAEKRHNETKAMDLERGLYFQSEGFKHGDFPSLGWDDRIGLAICIVGSGGGALGILLNRHAEASTTLLVVGGLCFLMGTAWSRATVQGLVRLRKIRHYEREIGQPIRNR